MPGWHMSSDINGYKSFLELLLLFESSPLNTKKTVILDKASKLEAQNIAGTKLISETKIIIHLVSPEDVWKLENIGISKAKSVNLNQN